MPCDTNRAKIYLVSISVSMLKLIFKLIIIERVTDYLRIRTYFMSPTDYASDFSGPFSRVTN